MTKYIELYEKEDSKLNTLLKSVSKSQDNKVERVLRYFEEKAEIYDEKDWTFILALCYAMCGKEGVIALFNALTGLCIKTDETFNDWKILLESRPDRPRKTENRSHIDLAIGDISDDEKTKSGIRLKKGKDLTRYVFCEMKWYSDISTQVTNDKRRNQLIRIIESALLFQDDPDLSKNENFAIADEIFVCVVAPAMFFQPEHKTRLYRYKLDDYSKQGITNIEAVLSDIYYPPNTSSESVLNEAKQKEIITRNVEKLTIRWRSYEDLVTAIPDKLIKEKMIKFMKKHVGEQLKEFHEIYQNI